MKIPTFSTAFIALLASAVTATPVANEENSLQARTPEDIETRSSDIGLYYCQAFDWGEPCLYERYEYGTCYNVREDYNDKISAIGPDENQGTCFLYPAYGCQTASFPSGILSIGYPGYSRLDGGVANWNDVISSFICYA